MTDNEKSKFFDKYKAKTADIHHWFSKQNPHSLFDIDITDKSKPKISFKPQTRNNWHNNMIRNDVRHTYNGNDNINRMSVFSIAEDDSNNPISKHTKQTDTVHKKCLDSIFSQHPNPSTYIAVEKPRLNLNDSAKNGDQYPKTLFEDMIKNSHDARNTRILSSQLEACVPVNTSDFKDEHGDVPDQVFVSVMESAEMKYLGRHPDQLHRNIHGFTLEKSIVAKSFVPLFLTFMLLLLFSKK
tara:strand:- start:17450 stop:18172 length:723 start_codon:yes stop_codon:yes gene_type:complete